MTLSLVIAVIFAVMLLRAPAFIICVLTRRSKFVTEICLEAIVLAFAAPSRIFVVRGPVEIIQTELDWIKIETVGEIPDVILRRSLTRQIVIVRIIDRVAAVHRIPLHWLGADFTPTAVGADGSRGGRINSLQNPAAQIVDVPTSPDFAAERNDIRINRGHKIESRRVTVEILSAARWKAQIDRLARIVTPHRNFQR